MKKWIGLLISLGYTSLTFATSHHSLMITPDALNEASLYDHVLETPSFFTRSYPLNLNSNLVVIPRAPGGFFLGVTGYMLHPDDNQLDYAFIDPLNPPYLPSLQSRLHTLDPNREFAYEAFVGYIFPYTGRDIQFSAYNFSGNAAEQITAGDNLLWTPLGLYDQTTRADAAAADFEVSVQQAKLTLGQTLIAGTRFRLHPSMGAAYANLDHRFDVNYLNASNFVAENFGSTLVHQDSHFSGVGPTVGLDAYYDLFCHFGLAGHFNASVLIGNISSTINHKDTLTDSTPEKPVPTNTTVHLEDTNRAVPHLDGKLGLFFEYPFCNSPITMAIEVGYAFSHFFNAVDTYRSAGGVVVNPDAVPALYTNTPWHIKQPYDLSLEGPYLTLSVSGVSCPRGFIEPACVTVPRLDGGFFIGVGSGYFRLQSNQREFGILETQGVSLGTLPSSFAPSTSATLESISSDYNYGVLLDVGYIFDHSPYDITLHYEATRSSDLKDIPIGVGAIFPTLATPIFDTQITRVLAQEVHSKLEFSYEEAHVEIGQAINATSLVWLRAFAGIEFADIESKLNTQYLGLFTLTGGALFPPFPTFPEEIVIQESHFKGYGPRLGVDMTLPLGLNFALTSTFAGGLLVGTTDAYLSDSISEGTVPPATILPAVKLGTQIDSETQVSPFWDLKLAFAYSFNFFTQARWTLELGYRTAHYFNSLTTFRHATNNAAVFVKQVDDATFDGPYINLTLSGFGRCPDDCRINEPYCVSVPELKGGFEFAVEGLHLRAYATNLDYGIVDPSPAISGSITNLGLTQNPSDTSTMAVLRPTADGGYRLHAGYIFPFTANDVSVNYIQFESGDSEEVNVTSPAVIWTITNGSLGAQAPVDPTVFPVFANHVEANAKFEWQTGNIEVGRRVKFHQLLTRFFAGLAYGKVDEDIHIVYTDGFTNTLTPVAVESDAIDQHNSFSGIGPRLGVMGDLGVACGFSLVGMAATEFLVGEYETFLTEISSSGDSAAIHPEDHDKHVVPVFEAKLGLAYNAPLLNCAHFGVELGYQTHHYFNVKDSIRFTDYASSFIKQDQDISFNGPYIGIQFGF